MFLLRAALRFGLPPLRSATALRITIAGAPIARYIVELMCEDTEDTPNHLAKLRRLLDEHHSAYLACYGADMAIPKLHWLFHIPDSLESTGVMLNCFKPERMHKLIQSVSVNNKRKNAFEDGVLPRLMYEYVNAPMTEDFRPYFLMNERSAPHLALALQPHFDALSRHGMTAQESERIHTPVGDLAAGDLVGMRNARGLEVARAVKFASVKCPLQDLVPTYYIIVQAATRHGERTWTIDGRQPPIIFPIATVVKALIYLEEAANVLQPLLPWRVLDARA